MSIKKNLIIVINLMISISTAFLATTGILYGAGEGQLGTYVIGWGYLKPYTMDSNIFTGILAFLVVIYTLKSKPADKPQLPKWLTLAYLMGSSCLVLTFLMAAVFLAPIEVMNGRSYFVMFSGEMIFFHFLNPVLAAISFVLLMTDHRFTLKDSFLGIIPTIVYATVYFIMVVVLKLWRDFYHFTFGGRYYLIPAVIVVVLGINFGISYLLTRLHNRFV